MNTDKFVLANGNSALAEWTAGPLCEGLDSPKQEGAAEAVESWGKITWRRFCRNKVALGSMFIFWSIILIAVLAPAIAPFDPNLTV